MDSVPCTAFCSHTGYCHRRGQRTDEMLTSGKCNQCCQTDHVEWSGDTWLLNFLWAEKDTSFPAGFTHLGGHPTHLTCPLADSSWIPRRLWLPALTHRSVPPSPSPPLPLRCVIPLTWPQTLHHCPLFFSLPHNSRPPGSSQLADAPYLHFGFCK